MQEPSQDLPPSRVYGWEDAARRLGFTSTYVMRLVQQGKGRPSVLVANGPRRMFTRADLEELAQAIGRPLREEEPTSHAA